jgi:hypothetical protein
VGSAPYVRLAAILVVLAVAVAGAQEPTEVGPLEGEDVVEGTVEGIASTFSVGLHGGLPGYRTVSGVAAIRSDLFGAAARLGYGAAGVSGGVQLRLYPPLPLPVPAYVAGGLDAYAGSTAWSLALGAHVPLGQHLRLDLEGGAAVSSTLQGASWAPYASVGVSYAFPVLLDPSLGAQPEPTFGPSAAVARCDAPPNPSAIADGVAAAVRSFVRRGMVLYGSQVRSLSYRYRISSTEVTGDTARVSVQYEGTAVETFTGNVVDARGVAQVELRWNGCSWVATSIDY